MKPREIDAFFDSLTDKELKAKWEKYSDYSKRNLTTVSELLDQWSAHYKNTFLIQSCENLISRSKIKVEEPERDFGFFL